MDRIDKRAKLPAPGSCPRSEDPVTSPRNGAFARLLLVPGFPDGSWVPNPGCPVGPTSFFRQLSWPYLLTDVSGMDVESAVPKVLILTLRFGKKRSQETK